jgi:hypothetical protein
VPGVAAEAGPEGRHTAAVVEVDVAVGALDDRALAVGRAGADRDEQHPRRGRERGQQRGRA